MTANKTSRFETEVFVVLAANLESSYVLKVFSLESDAQICLDELNDWLKDEPVQPSNMNTIEGYNYGEKKLKWDARTPFENEHMYVDHFYIAKIPALLY